MVIRVVGSSGPGLPCARGRYCPAGLEEVLCPRGTFTPHQGAISELASYIVTAKCSPFIMFSLHIHKYWFYPPPLRTSRAIYFWVKLLFRNSPAVSLQLNSNRFRTVAVCHSQNQWLCKDIRVVCLCIMQYMDEEVKWMDAKRTCRHF